jgi:hypothetical protein
VNELEMVRQAGLTLYQSKAYLALKQQPDQTPTEVAHRSGVPQAKIYEILFAGTALRNFSLSIQMLFMSAGKLGLKSPAPSLKQ